MVMQLRATDTCSVSWFCLYSLSYHKSCIQCVMKDGATWFVVIAAFCSLLFDTVFDCTYIVMIELCSSHFSGFEFCIKNLKSP